MLESLDMSSIFEIEKSLGLGRNRPYKCQFISDFPSVALEKVKKRFPDKYHRLCQLLSSDQFKEEGRQYVNEASIATFGALKDTDDDDIIADAESGQIPNEISLLCRVTGVDTKTCTPEPTVPGNDPLMQIHTVTRSWVLEMIDDAESMLTWINLTRPTAEDGDTDAHVLLMNQAKFLQVSALNYLDDLRNYHKERVDDVISAAQKLLTTGDVANGRKLFIDYDENYFQKAINIMTVARDKYLDMYLTVTEHEKFFDSQLSADGTRPADHMYS